MTEYIAQCRAGQYDKITARNDGSSLVELTATSHGEHKMETYYLSADEARTFARGILALADEVDGGETTAASGTRPKVGDFVEITEDNRSVHVGRRGYLRAVDEFDPELPYRLELNKGAGTYDWWTHAIRKVDNPTDVAPLADWEQDLLDSHAAAQSPAPSRAALLGQARDLLDGSHTYTAHDLIELANFLAGE